MKRICVSPCLLGVPCRYDGTARPTEISALGPDVEWVPFCPESEAGLGCPREPIELVETAPGEVRVLGVRSRRDVTDRLRAVCETRAEAIRAERGVDLFLLKARSPSCGVESPLHAPDGTVVGTTPGEWARTVRESFPCVPVWTEEDLASAPAKSGRRPGA